MQDHDTDAAEFTAAVLRFREERGNRFPTAADFLWIVRELGYRKRATLA
jgi:hypothetical protein